MANEMCQQMANEMCVSKWLLTVEQKELKLSAASDLFNVQKWIKFSLKTVTDNETWVYAYAPKTKQRSQRPTQSLQQKKAHKVQNNPQLMFTAFF